MSSTFSNTDTGKKEADPYTAKNMDDTTSLKEKVEDLSEFVTACKFGMMTTRDEASGMLVSRCMALAAKENEIDLIFHTNTESGKTDELSGDPHLNIAFLNSSGEWASISGTSSIVTDRETVKKYYSSSLKAWLGDLGDGTHDGGPEDPRIGVIRVKMNTATYAVVRKNAAGRALDVAQGMLTGSTAKVNKLRSLSEGEVETWRSSQRMVQ